MCHVSWKSKLFPMSPENNILYASDYPHWDSNFPDSVATLITRSDVSDTLKRKISFENPQRYYALKDR
jgi:predicted TIM-barrel fold metal-dependent hydrolase